MGRKYRNLNNDPRVMNAKFKSICPTCNKETKKDDKIVYFPKERKAYCWKCSESEYNRFSALAHEEGNGYCSY